MKKLYSFLMLVLALVLGVANAHAQSILVNPDEIFTGPEYTTGTLSVYFSYSDADYVNDDSPYRPLFQFYDADGITPVESSAYSWLYDVFFTNSYAEVEYRIYDNSGIERTAYFRVVLCDRHNASNVIAVSNLVTISQGAADCPAPDHFALTEGSITQHGGTFTWTGYTNEYNVYVDYLVEADLGRLYEADFEIAGNPWLWEEYSLSASGFSWTYEVTDEMLQDPEYAPEYTAHSGYRCMKSDNYEAGTTGRVSLYVPSQQDPTIISFWALLSAGGNNKGSFWIDGIKVLEISGAEFQTKDWTQYTFELETYRDHTLEWKYTKNDDTRYGEDAFFIDDILMYSYDLINSYNPVYVSDTTVTLNDLNIDLYGGYTYRAYVQGLCPDETGPSNYVFFTTAYQCQVPDHLTATNVTGASADLRWEGYGYDHFDIHCTTEDLTPVDVHRVGRTNSSTITHLSPYTTYKVWLETTCESSMNKATRGLLPAISDTLLFTTSCGAALPYFEDFESTPPTTSDQVHYHSLPVCWESYNETTNDTWYDGYPTVMATVENSRYSYSGEQFLCLKSRYASGVNNTDQYAILPAMGTVPVNTLQLSFYACRGRDNYNNIPLYVGVMSDPSDIGTFEPFETIEITGVNTNVWGNDYDGYWYHGYNQYTVDFSNYTGQGKYIAFMMERATSSSEPKAIYIDDISCVSSVVPSSSCPTPTGLTASNVTHNSADLSWNNNTDISAYNVQYREGASMDNAIFEESFDNGIPYSWSQYSGFVDNVLAGTSALAYSGDWGTASKVFGSKSAKLNIFGENCRGWLVSPETDPLPAGAALTFDLALTRYNSSSAPYETGDDDRFAVLVYANDRWTKLREWNNSGSSYVYNNIATTGEKTFIDLSAYEGKTVKIAFYGESTVDNNGDNDLYIDNMAIGTPTAAGEWQDVAQSITDTVAPLTGLIPETRYEARVQGNCGETSEWSEPISFTTLSSCLTVTNLQVTQTTTSTATITWTNGNEEFSWDIYVTTSMYDDPDANTTPTEEYIDSKPYIVENLNPANTYYIYVRAVCSETKRSVWSSPVTVKTKCEAMPLPYEYGFEEYNEFQYCWSSILAPEGYNNVFNTTTKPKTGSRHLSLYWSGNPNSTLIAILPEVQANYDLKNYAISFYARKKEAYCTEDFVGKLHVGVISNPTDASSFVQVGEDITLDTVYTQYTVDLSNYAGDGHYLAIKATSDRCGYLYIDDINVSQTAQATYTINASVNPENSGTVTGTAGNDVFVSGASYAEGTNIILRATPSDNYHFVNWNDGNTDNPRTITVVRDSSFTANFAVNSFVISTSANPESGGTVTGSGTYDNGATATLTATANTGYTFIKWNDGNTENPRTITVVRDSSFTANFDTVSHAITVAADPTNGGTVTGGGSYKHFTTATLTANPATGYHFVNWTKDGVQVSTDAEYTFQVTENAAYVAHFALNSYTIAASANPENGGSVDGAGSYNHGTNATLTANPATGYHFVNWTKDGVQVSTDAEYTFQVTENAAYVAHFALNSYNIAASANPENGGIVTGADTYEYGANATLTATANEGYTFIKWNDGNTDNPRTITVVRDSSFTANFDTVSHAITVAANPTNGGTVTGGGSYKHFTTATLTATAATGYHFVNWTKDGVQVSTDAEYTFQVTENAAYVAHFALNSYNIAASANPENGGIVTGADTYEYGANATLTATANEGYTFIKWNDGNTENPRTITVVRDSSFTANFDTISHTITVAANPTNGGTVTGGGSYKHFTTATLTATANEGYTFIKWNDGNTDNPRTITVVRDSNFTANFDTISHTITVAANPENGGTVTGAGSYNHGTNATLTANPAPDYRFVNWTKNWNEVSTDASYTFQVTESGTYVANFAMMDQVDAPFFSPVGGDYYGEQYVRIYCNTAGATIYYTLDGSEPTTSSTEYTDDDAITISATTTVKAIAAKAGMITSEVATATYTILPRYTINVTINPTNGGSVYGDGTYNSGATVTLEAVAGDGYTFVNWTKNGVVVSTDAEYSFTVTENADYVANFEPRIYTIFYMDVNDTLAKQTYAYGAPITPIENPTKVGYTFTGWRPEVPVTMPHNDFFVNAQWEINTYTINVTATPSDLGSVSGAGSYDYGATATLTATANTGYRFVEWNDGNTNNPRYVRVSHDSNFIAHFSTQDYVLNYMDNSTGIDILIRQQTYAYGATITPIDNPTKVGYTFIGWEPELPSMMPAHEVTVYAQWQINTYNITATANPTDGGMVSGTADNDAFVNGTYDYGTEITLTATANTGYTFIYWTTGEDTIYYDTYSFTVTKAAAYVAHFTHNSYAITAQANPNNGGTVDGYGNYFYGETVTLTARPNEGYTFINWMKDEDTVSFNASFTFRVVAGGDYVANFALRNYTLTYMNGNTVLAEQTYAYGATITPIEAPTLEGFTFTGWSPAVPETMPAQDLFVYAQWEINTYTITATANPTNMGSVSGGRSYEYGDFAILTARPNEGYRFVEWNDGNTTNPRTIMVVCDSTFIAQFATQEYVLNYMDNSSGQDILIQQQTYAYGETITPIENPTKVGYTFLGWEPELPPTMPAHGVTVYAKWQINTYEITATANPTAGGTVEGTADNDAFVSGTSYNHGTEITLTATANTGYTFIYWTTGEDTIYYDTYSFPVTEAAAYVAHFSRNSYAIYGMANPTNGGTVDGYRNYFYGETATLIARPATGYIFTNWTQDGVQVSTDAEYSFVVYNHGEYIANFTLMGTVATPIFSPVEGYYNDAQNVEISCATEGATIYYTMDGSNPTTSSSVYTGAITISETTTVKAIAVKAGMNTSEVATATYTIVPIYTIAITINPSNAGTVLGMGLYEDGTNATLTATPNEGYTFTGWTINGSTVTDNPYTFTVTGDSNIIANFSINSYAINASVNPAEGGTVSGTADNDVFVNGTYDYGTAITLTATANAGYTFVNWTENGTVVNATNPYSFTVNGDRNLVANFTITVPVTIIASDETICDGGQVTLSANIGNYDFPNLTYEWYTVNGTDETPISGATGSTVTVYPHETTNYRVYVLQNSSDRIAMDDATITVLTLEPISITHTPNDTICDGGKITLTANSAVQGEYTWFKNGQIMPNTNSNTITDSVFTIRNDITTYEYMLLFNSALPGCQQTVYTEVTVFPSPTVTITGNSSIYNNTNVMLTANVNDVMATATHTYQWMLNNNDIDSEVNSTLDKYYASNEDPYIFTVRVSNEVSGCTAVSEPYSVLVNDTASLQPTTYEITASVNPANSGTVEGAGTYENGTTATLTARPATGYSFTNWTENGTVVNATNPYTFTVTGDRTLVANFEADEYTITATANPANSGSVEGAGTYSYGTEATLTATPATGYHFTNWTENGTVVNATNPYTFTVTGDRTLVANFEADEYTITATANPANSGSVEGAGTYSYGTEATLTATPATGYSFTNWTENGTVVNATNPYTFTVTGDRTLVANFEAIEYTIAASANPTNSGSVEGAGTYSYGTEATLTATPATGYSFTNWTENGTVVNATNPYTFTVTGDRTLVANFEADEYTIAASAIPANSGSVVGAGTYSYGTEATLTATPATGYSFTNWTENGTVVNATNPYTFTVTGDRTLVANFEAIEYTIAASANPTNSGSVEGAGTYSYGTEATLTATPATGYSFTNWTENGTVVNATNPYTFTVTGDRTLVANFEADEYTIAATANPANSGSVEGTSTYSYGTEATLTATPATGYHFTNWTENGTVVNATNPYTFTVTGDRTLVANFEANEYTIAATANPANSGSVEGAGTYSYGTEATLTATPATGYHFTNWTENGTVVNATNPFTFTVTGDRTLVANFEANEYTIAATANPANSGSVEGAGTYSYGTEATLTATPATGYSFTNWTENGTVVNATNPYTFTVTGDRTLVANFEAIEYTIAASAIPANSGSVVGAGTYSYGTEATLTATPATGYHFTNWTENGTVVNATNPYTFTVTGDRTLVATFTANEYTITFMDGNDVLARDTLNYGETITAIVDPTREGYTFTGWDPELPETMPANDLTVNAQWQVNSYNITLNQVTGGTITVTVDSAPAGTTTSTTANYGAPVMLSVATEEGYTFGDYIVTDTNNNAIEVASNGFTMPASDVTVTATFAIAEYVLTFMDDNNVLLRDTLNYGDAITTIPNPTREGYTFLGWDAEVPATMPANDLTFQAQWQLNSYRINIDQVAGGTLQVIVEGSSVGSILGDSAAYNSWVQLDVVVFDGYTFGDYIVTDANNNTIEVSSDGFTMPASDVTVTATFTANEYTITYMDGNDVLDVQTYTFGETITPIEDPVREGYTFTGWNPALPETMPAEHLTVVAQWQINSYTVNVTVCDETPWGTVTGSGTFIYGTTDTLTATAFENYTFIGWSDGETASPRVITVSSDSNITAFFIPEDQEEIEIAVNDTAMGAVSIDVPGSASVTTMVTITATPEPHYHFVSWSDGNTENPRVVPLMEALRLTAVFAIDQHTITVLSADENMGTVSIGGTYDYGTEILISADALPGYEFTGWNDGNTENPRNITVEQDSTFTAYFHIVDGINDVNMPAINIYSNDNHIVITNAEGFPVQIFDMSGRLIVRESRISDSSREYTILSSGIYLVKVGDNVVKKVTVIIQ